MSSHPPVPSVGRFTGIVLGLVVFVCVTMIGGTGYLKYQLDVAQTVLAAPDSALGGDQGLFDRLRRDLGYGGFLGLAQNYVSTHDASGFAEMKAHIKSADEIITHLPDKTTAETRHELVSIVAVYDTALQKISAPPGDALSDFSASDLAPLYATLPILDARVSGANAEARFAAQNKMQFWAMLLTLVSWCSLIIAAACAAGIYLTLRDKHSAPMRALAQSVQNMSRGDMRTAIWGTERQDMIGELARAVDMARYHFSHLPDLSLLSEQGPVRMRFEGGTRSLFEAMMKAISSDSENIREQSSSLSGAVTQQREAIAAMSQKVEMVLQNILQHGQNGDQQIRQAIHDMVGSAEGLKNAHAHAADQLNRLIPHIQDRATSMGEIAQIAGKQIGHTIQALSASELGLKTNAENAKETLIKLASTADDLGERLFGAINLLQASGKVLAETTEDIRGRFGEHPAAQTVDLTPLTERLEEITNRLTALQTTVDRAPETQPVPMLPDFDMDKLGQGIVSDIEQLISSRIDPKFAAIGQSLAQNGVDAAVKINTALMELSDRIGALSVSLPDELRHTLQEDMQRLSAQIDVAAIGEKIMALQAGLEKPAASPLPEAQIKDLWQQLSSQIEASRVDIARTVQKDVGGMLPIFEQTLAAVQRTVEISQSEMMKPAPRLSYTMPPELQQQLLDQWMQMSAQIEASRTSLVEAISDQIDKMETRLAGKNPTPLSKTAADYATQRQIEQQTQILSELVATLGVIDEHMQQIKSEMHVAASGRLH